MSYLCMFVGGSRHGDTEIFEGGPLPRHQYHVAQSVDLRRMTEPWSVHEATTRTETYNVKRAKAMVDDLEVYIAIHDEAARHWGEWRHAQECEYQQRMRELNTFTRTREWVSSNSSIAGEYASADQYYRFRDNARVNFAPPPNEDAPDDWAGADYNIAGGNGNTRG